MNDKKTNREPSKQGGKARKPVRRRPGYTPRVVVKFHDYVEIPYEDGAEKHIQERSVGPWLRLAERFQGIRLRRLYTAASKEQILRLVSKARQRDHSYRPPNFLTFFVVDSPPGADPRDLSKALSEWETVATAYFDPPGGNPAVNPADDDRSPHQGYLDPAPDGIDAEYAWGIPGGDGAGQNLIDLELGWTLDHEDLLSHGATVLHGDIDDYSRPHGTSVLGEICAVDNAVGCVGITPNIASVDVVSYWGSTRSNAMLAAIDNLPFGGVLLLEAQVDETFNGRFWPSLPIEVLDAEYETIRLATALGIVVVEAAGNGTNDLDTFEDNSGKQVLNRCSADFKDSGAIMVGSAVSTHPHCRTGVSNYGSRIDCYAWGNSVYTLESTDYAPFSTTCYRPDFNSTSSASPIIAGAALAVQGAAEVLGYRFNGWQMRGLLTNSASSTESADPDNDQIGVMPNLRAILQGDLLGVAPDLYLRDFVGDNGDPHTQSISASPDVILRSTAVADPQAEFGEGSGTENSNTLGSEAEAGQDNFIYVRVSNRGGMDAADVTATVYWAPVASLITPDLWTLVGSVVIPNVPASNVLTVSDAITWPAAAIPESGPYSFVAIVGNAMDPAPLAADFLKWDRYRRFIRDNNNVTWRNFNLVDNEPDPSAGDPAEHVALPFLATGAPDGGRQMELEIVARLPQGARAMLEVPLHLIEVIQNNVRVRVDKKRRIGILPVNPHGRRSLGKILFPAKSRTRLRLLVHIPREFRRHSYEVFVRQTYRGEEVGRVTWRLAPIGRKRTSTEEGG